MSSQHRRREPKPIFKEDTYAPQANVFYIDPVIGSRFGSVRVYQCRGGTSNNLAYRRAVEHLGGLGSRPSRISNPTNRKWSCGSQPTATANITFHDWRNG